MQTEFTKADLKDRMIVHFDDGEKAVLVNDHYTTKNSFECVNGRLILKRSGRKVTKIEYGNEVVWELQSNKMTTEEMRQELEELTGEKIEIEPSREEMIGTCYKYCDSSRCISNCILSSSGDCVFRRYSDEQLKQCYEKVMEDGRKESQKSSTNASHRKEGM